MWHPGHVYVLERELCTAMVKHLMPNITDEQLEGYLNIRFKPVASDLERGSVLASATNQEAADGLLEEDDMQIELKQFVEKKVAPKKCHKQASAGNALPRWRPPLLPLAPSPSFP